jgi:hypothetical protein
MNKSFLKYFANIDKILGEYYLTHGIEWDRIFGEVEEYFVTCY